MPQISKPAGMEFLHEEVLEHFCSKMGPSICHLQPSTEPTAKSQPRITRALVTSLDAFKEQLLDCCQGLHYTRLHLTSFVQVPISHLLIRRLFLRDMDILQDWPVLSTAAGFHSSAWRCSRSQANNLAVHHKGSKGQKHVATTVTTVTAETVVTTVTAETVVTTVTVETVL